MLTYCGVDFHSRQQKVVFCDLATGEDQRKELKHQSDEVRQFYTQLPKPVIVGLEATGSSQWFEKLLVALGHEVWIGNATEIRRRARSRQKNDWRDAELVLDLMVKRSRQLLSQSSTWAGRLSPLALRSGGQVCGRSASGLGLSRTTICRRTRLGDQMLRRPHPPTSRGTRRNIAQSRCRDGA